MNLDKFITSIETNGGASLSLKTGVINPSFGYFASFEGRESKLRLNTLNNLPMTKMYITNYILANLDALNTLGNFLGAWVEDDFIVLDVSKQFAQEFECMEFAKLNNQRAIFNAKTKEVIQTN